jgi:hypothetical protein
MGPEHAIHGPGAWLYICACILLLLLTFVVGTPAEWV